MSISRRNVLRATAVTALAACTGVEPDGTDAAPASPDAQGTAGSSAPDVPAPTPESSPTPEPSASASVSPSPATTVAPTQEPSSPPSPTAEATAAPVPEPSPSPTAAPPPPAAAGSAHHQEICRQSLGLPDPRPDDRTHTIAGLMLHHTAVVSSSASQAPGKLRAHTNYHRDQGWPDIAYHVGVDLDGNVYGLRDTGLPGDTFTDYDPTGWFLLVAEGDFSKTTPTPELLESASRVFAWASIQFNVSIDTLSGHRDEASTTCPGDRLYGALGSIRDRARQIVAESSGRRTVLCGAEGDARVAAIESGN